MHVTAGFVPYHSAYKRWHVVAYSVAGHATLAPDNVVQTVLFARNFRGSRDSPTARTPPKSCKRKSLLAKLECLAYRLAASTQSWRCVQTTVQYSARHGLSACELGRQALRKGSIANPTPDSPRTIPSGGPRTNPRQYLIRVRVLEHETILPGTSRVWCMLTWLSLSSTVKCFPEKTSLTFCVVARIAVFLFGVKQQRRRAVTVMQNQSSQHGCEPDVSC